jgi:hypothetical protein
VVLKDYETAAGKIAHSSPAVSDRLTPAGSLDVSPTHRTEQTWYTGQQFWANREATMNRTTQTLSIPVPREVQAFAAEAGVAPYLPSVLAMTRRRFPDALRLTVLVEEDPEIANDRHIVIEVDVQGITAEQYVEADWQWGHELFQLCPAPLICVFRLSLNHD